MSFRGVGAELVHARRTNRILGDERHDVIRSREENLRLRRGVRSFTVKKGYRCGKAQDVVIAQYMLRVSRDSLSQQQRAFLVAGMFHVGVLGLESCPLCMALYRMLGLYETWWREGKMLEDWERVSCLDPVRLRRNEILQVASVINRRLAFSQAVETQYDPATGKLAY